VLGRSRDGFGVLAVDLVQSDQVDGHITLDAAANASMAIEALPAGV
jgi:hypothetical protein